MKATVCKWGNSMALRIPKPILDENSIQVGSQVEIISKDGKIILEPSKKKIREGWEKAAMEAHQNNDDEPIMDFSNEFDKEDWIW